MIWKWKLSDNDSVEYSLNVLLGTEKLQINGEKQKIKNKMFGGRHELELNGKILVLTTKPNLGLAPGVHLSYDNTEIEPTNGPSKRHPPKWAWVFAAICMVIPVITVGGALPAAYGIIGAVSCISVSRKASISVLVRLILCVLITAVFWGLFLATIAWASAI